MLSLIRWWVVAVGIAGGALTVALSNLLLAFILSQLGVADAGIAARPISVLIGFAGGSAVAARMAPVAGRFHGAVAALGMAGLIIVAVGASGSPLPLPQVVLLVLLAVVIGWLTGWFADRHTVE
ncbi:MAG: hypothetical protein GEU79_06555 [Acidimicrobiia bacterium]|nr:hypothetical protein [Acidimicrobiia bacterium]